MSIINHSICKTKLYKMIKEQVDWRIKKLSLIDQLKLYHNRYMYYLNNLNVIIEFEKTKKNDRK